MHRTLIATLLGLVLLATVGMATAAEPKKQTTPIDLEIKAVRAELAALREAQKPATLAKLRARLEAARTKAK